MAVSNYDQTLQYDGKDTLMPISGLEDNEPILPSSPLKFTKVYYKWCPILQSSIIKINSLQDLNDICYINLWAGGLCSSFTTSRSQLNFKYSSLFLAIIYKVSAHLPHWNGGL